MTKTNHIFNYENGKMVEKKPKQSDYLKSIDFLRKQFFKAVLNIKKQSKNSVKVNWKQVTNQIEFAERGNDFIAIIDSLPLEGGRITE